MNIETNHLQLKRKGTKLKKKTPQMIDVSRRLYIRMPSKINESFEIKELHPLITNVILTRQRSRFCFVEFADADNALKALSDLQDKCTSDGKHIVVTSADMKPR